MSTPTKNVHDTRVSDPIAEIWQLITRLMNKLGAQGYCVWLANFTPVEWLTVTPLEEIRNTLAAKLAETQETP